VAERIDDGPEAGFAGSTALEAGKEFDDGRKILSLSPTEGPNGEAFVLLSVPSTLVEGEMILNVGGSLVTGSPGDLVVVCSLALFAAAWKSNIGETLLVNGPKVDEVVCFEAGLEGEVESS
jgi:hypothetical protein